MLYPKIGIETQQEEQEVGTITLGLLRRIVLDKQHYHENTPVYVMSGTIPDPFNNELTEAIYIIPALGCYFENQNKVSNNG